MKTISITLAGRTYAVESLKFKAESEWRKKYDAPLTNLINAISTARDVAGKEFEKPGDFMKEVGTVLLAHATDLVQALVHSPDTMLEALCDYAPAIQADRDFIEENAYLDEISKAFLEVLQLAYPFGQVLSLVTSLGQLEKQTSPSSPSPSGA